MLECFDSPCMCHWLEKQRCQGPCLDLIGEDAQPEIPFALSVACDSKRSRSVRQWLPFDFDPAGLRSGWTVGHEL